MEEVKRNKNNKLYNTIECSVCRKEFKWVEDMNAEVIVDKILQDNEKNIFVLDVVAKCPYCGYKVKYIQQTIDNRYR
ncbi:hypothetical protein EXN00_09750 [Clostridium botulinum]|uniref:hypothetical protein n=1 Tax=Clostridium botulinum TaxID=1491 RepID=UPI00077362CC|nr:hypothetical protein [Clostridium botulinum]AUN22524.1 hypothetical protein RSJ22_14190 [Clostridium botulinum]MBN3411203.1 hypothetical protein [Clostridium botulinum]MBN3418605.1 hypothetical protein [Clostridium botulinum]MBN3426115.1 hypothetical protein [Clostridium botulinum]MBN3430442.1 hypothetical protein [Clostridium botulinum]